MVNSERRTPITGVGRAVFLFFLRFLAASILLYLVHAKIGAHYMRLVSLMAKPLLSLNGIELNMQRALKVTEEISLNPVVFLSLVIATRPVQAMKSLGAALAGFAILSVANALTVFLIFVSAQRGSESLWTGTEFFNLTMNFFVPLLLWVVLLPSQVISTMRPAPAGHGE
jgi:hypothetical protein